MKKNKAEKKTILNLLLDKIIYINRKINSFYELPQLLDSIMKTTTEIISSEGASVLLLDEEKKNLIFYSVEGDKKEIIKQFTVPIEKGIAGYTVRHREPVIVNDVTKDTRFYDQIDAQCQFRTRNIIAFPLIVKQEVIGVLEVINALAKEGFKDSDLKIISYISELSALAIYNRVLYDNLNQSHKLTNKRVQELNALYSLLNSFTLPMEKINLRSIFKNAGRIVADTLECGRVSFFLKVGKKENRFEMVCGIGFDETEIKEGQIISLEEARIMKMVEKFREPIYVFNEKEANFSLDYLDTQKYKTRAFISLPILSQEEVIGFVNVTERIRDKREKGFDDFDFSLLKSVVITLGNIYHQYQTNLASIQQKIINRELETAATIQRKMLAQSYPSYPDVDICAINIPARNVSGDFYGFQKISDSRMAVYIGDVSGKGLAAAFFMATASTSLREKISFYQSPAKVLGALNNTLFEEVQDGMFVTLAYFLVNFQNLSIQYSFAGHNNQFLYRSGEGDVVILKTPGKPIGIMSDLNFSEKEVKFKKGDILLLCTDGVTEALLNNQEEEGENLLKEILSSSHSMKTEDLAKLIKSVFVEEGKELFDDFTLVIIKF